MMYLCSKCGQTESVNSRKAKCDCGGLWRLKWAVPKFDLSLIDNNIWGIYRYRAFLPLIDESWKDITLGEGMTSIIQLDQDVLLKMDFLMPTLSFKDRGASILIAHCKSIGVDNVIQDSSGNAGNSIAAYCAKAGIGCEIYVPEGTSEKKINMIKAHGSKVNIIPGSRDHCADVCREQVDKTNRFYASHVYNPFFYEGTKTYIYEVYEQLKRIPEYIFLPLGNGTLFIGVMKALEELIHSDLLEKMPSIIAVQSENCSPFYNYKVNNEFKNVTATHTLAEGIAIGTPMRAEEIIEYIDKYNIEVITAEEDKILDAREYLAIKGVYCEHTTAASYAAYLKYIKLYGKLSDVLISMCGAGIKSDK